MSKEYLATIQEVVDSLDMANMSANKGISDILIREKKGIVKLKNNGYSGKDVVKRVLSSKYVDIYIQKISAIHQDELYHGSVQHGVDHNLRVSILAAFLGVESGLSENDFKIIIDGALYHDIGRVDDSEEPNHGLRAAKKLDNLGLGYSDADMKILKFIVEAHSVEDTKMEILCKKYGFTSEEQKRAINLGKILKDADALDLARMRAVNPELLRTDTARKMLGAAYELVANINSFNVNDREWLSLDEWITLKDTITKDENSQSYKTMLRETEDWMKKRVSQGHQDMLKRGGRRFVKFLKQFEIELKADRTTHEQKSKSDDRITICGKQYTKEQLGEMYKDAQARANMQRYIGALSSEPPKITIHQDKNGKVLMERGTLVQGIKFEESVLDSVSKYGLISYSLLTEGHKNTSEYEDCTCVFRAAKTQPVQSYYEEYSTLEYMKQRHDEEQTGNPISRSSNGKILTFRPKEENLFLPSPSRQRVAFIVDSRTAAMFCKKKLARYNRAYGVQFGIPPTHISGIMVSSECTKEQLEYLKKSFKDQYIVSTEGELLYTPERAKVEVVPEVEVDKNKNPLYWVGKHNSRHLRFGISDIESVDKEVQDAIRALREKDEKEWDSDAGRDR